MHDFVIGCDNAAVDLKNILKKVLIEKGINVEDVGAFSKEDDTVYPLYAKKVCERIIKSGYAKRGVLVCGTGIGVCMVANKFKGIRAAVGHDLHSVRRSILSNNGNVICFGERVIGPELAKALLEEWIGLEFVDGSSTPKVGAIIAIEDENFA